jgi:hypothetical protein
MGNGPRKDKEQRYHDGNLACTHNAATLKDAGSSPRKGKEDLG